MRTPSSLSRHYRKLLQLPLPWHIIRVVLDEEQKQVEIYVEWPSNRMVRCPECNKRCTRKDHREERTWRHLDVMEWKTYVHCTTPRSDCPIHGVMTVTVPWADAYVRWTHRFELRVLEVLEQVPSNAKAARLLSMRWEQIQAVKKRAVERGLARRDTKGIAHLGVDEKSFGKKERFITVLSDLDSERVIEVTPSKSKEAAMAAFAAIPMPHRASVEAIAMDMSAAYEVVCRELVPQAEIVYDKFHVEKMLSESVDTVRRKAHKELLAQGVTIFKRTRYLWLKRPERWTTVQREQYRDVEREFGVGKLAQSKIGRAWSMKEAFRPFWNFVYPGVARRYFRRWYYWMTHSKLPPMIHLARTLQDHLEGLLSYFRHGITNAFSEGINSKIQDVKSAARGYRNFGNYRIAVLFACGKLDLRP